MAGVNKVILVGNLGRDPQLEKAVDVVLQEMKQREELPDAPKFPRDR